MKYAFLFLFTVVSIRTVAQQQNLTPELLWKLNRVSASGLTEDKNGLYYSVTSYDVPAKKRTTRHFYHDLKKGTTTGWQYPEGKTIISRRGDVWYAKNDSVLFRSNNAGAAWEAMNVNLKGADNIQVSPDGKHVAYSKKVAIIPVNGTERHPDLPDNTAQVYTDLLYRHWDTWSDGGFAHVFVSLVNGGTAKDIMEGEPYYTPQSPFGGAEDFIWSPDSKGILYVCKKKYGKEYAISTNTDLYYYDLTSGNTINRTEGMMGYDVGPVYSPDGTKVAWTSMARDGYESDKNDLIITGADPSDTQRINLTAGWDGTVNGFAWDNTSKKIYFTAAVKGTVQLFDATLPGKKQKPAVRQITHGTFDVTGIAGISGKEIIVSRTDMNHASELFAVHAGNGQMRTITNANDSLYSQIKSSRTELRMVTTTDNKQMGVWVVYPPDFDSTKKYPALLYCQGGPQSALSQFYSFRWNFQLMAAQGYIVVAPNRRGMPGWGTEWNEAISKDWGGQPMRDYLSAIDAIAAESYVDRNRLGCVGASYGGYSVFMLAGIHENRFKSFISHNGLFDIKSWYGTTEELWFANWDAGGSYWSNPTPETYTKFNPSNLVDKWNTPIMIIQGGIDYRVPIEQGLGAFQAAQLKGIKSKLLYYPDENHWILDPQNALVWQREFFRWLEETLSPKLSGK